MSGKPKFNLPIGALNLMSKVGYQHTPNHTGSQVNFASSLNRDFALSGAGKPIEGFNSGAYYTNTFNLKSHPCYQTSDD